MYFLITAVSTLITLLLFWYFILSRQRNRPKSQRDPCPI
jgi:preprotein translocase subunit YajC